MQDRQTKRVLIVEDEGLISMDIQDVLSGEGYAVAHVAATEPNAMSYLDEETPDIALLDINLGDGRNSHEIARRLLDARCSVLFVTGHNRRSYEMPETLKSVPWLQKPFSSDDLVDAIAKLK